MGTRESTGLKPREGLKRSLCNPYPGDFCWPWHGIDRNDRALLRQRFPTFDQPSGDDGSEPSFIFSR
jgi:hypothetical protein